jgi:protein involved in polysaccharide export with SLBB domain/capsular polysaccharide biosynthesis protein
MSEQEDLSITAVQKKREQTVSPQVCVATQAPSAEVRSTPLSPPEVAPAKGMELPFDPLRLVAATLRNWKWLPIAALALLTPAIILGLFRFRNSYSVTVQLIRREVGNTIRATLIGEAFKPRQVTVATVVNVMQSPKLLARVGSLAHPPLSNSQLLGALTIKPERDTDLISVTMKGQGSVQATATLVNLYAQEVVALTAQMQSEEAAELEKFLKGQIEHTDTELEAVNRELLEFTRGANFYGADREVEAYLRQLADVEIRLETARANSKAVEFRITNFEHELGQQSPAALELSKARDSLATLGTSYTTNNPIVKEAQDKVSALEQKLARDNLGRTNAVGSFRYTENTVANDLYLRLLVMYGERESLAKELAQVEEFKSKVQEKLRSIPEKSQHYAQIAARQQSLQATRDLLAGRQREALVYEESSPGLYRLFAKATEESVETSSRWKKTCIVALAAVFFGIAGALFIIWGRELLDFRVVSAGDLKRATQLPVVMRLPNLAGFNLQELSQWRFRAWSKLMRQIECRNTAQILLGFTSATAGEGKTTIIRHLCQAARDRRLPVVTVSNAPPGQACSQAISLETALTTPATVTRHLREQPGIPLELLYDPAWTWSLENRARLQRAFESWQQFHTLVLLVELPAMTDLDALFAAELLPKLIWVAASGHSQQGELAKALDMMAASDLKLSAAVLNRESAILSRLASLGIPGLAALMIFCGGQSPVNAADSAINPAATSTLSVSSGTAKLAPWQERLTVGAGDIFHIRIYGRTDSVRIYVPISPDGRISFLEAQSVPVAGLTVDEMRLRLDEELGKFYKNARTIVTPAEWHSKKYFLLGAVVDRGAYTLDRPLTVIEAVARARGIASGLFEHNTVELADMARAFMVRDGKRLPVDFERLFHQGDLSQNILIEPGDYLYLPSGTVNEVYLLGAVRSPGPLGLTSENSLIGVITVRGGLLPEAYKQRVLVVRGSLEKPETFVINVAAILSGQEKDFQLKPKDIIYVARKPWQKAAELTQMAVNAFVQAMTSAWVGNNIFPIDASLLPHL